MILSEVGEGKEVQTVDKGESPQALPSRCPEGSSSMASPSHPNMVMAPRRCSATPMEELAVQSVSASAPENGCFHSEAKGYGSLSPPPTLGPPRSLGSDPGTCIHSLPPRCAPVQLSRHSLCSKRLLGTCLLAPSATLGSILRIRK